MGKNVYGDILEFMPCIQGDDAATIAIVHLIADYLETTSAVMLPDKVESIVLQNVLQWIHSGTMEIRWNATRVLLTLSRNPENCGIVNHQLMNLIDSDNVYIKNLIYVKFMKQKEFLIVQKNTSFLNVNMIPTMLLGWSVMK